MSLQISDPLALLPYQTGMARPPLVEQGAKGSTDLDAQQRSIVIGEPVPIVFGRRVDGIGGVFVSPGATEARFSNNGTTNELTVNFHLVLSEGDLPQLQLRDVYQRACRVGTWAQTYDRRAGTWTPGNYTTIVSGKEPWNCPYYCGTSGKYSNMTTLSYQNNHADGDSTWDKQVHCFVRDGMQVTRILDDTYGPSNNVVDLALYLIRQSSRFPESMLDLDAMEDAAEFTNVNGFFYNGEFKESTNLEDWLEEICPRFLLRVSDKNGKKSLRPRLPVNTNGTIKTTAVDWVFGFTEDHILPDGFEIEYIPLSERKDICLQMLWRQQPDNDIGIIRTTEVRFAGEAAAGPFEQNDMSQFCVSENHAVKVGAYMAARRRYVTHNLRIRVRPDSYNSTLALGDIVRVRLRRETTVGTTTFHDYLYEVERINRNISGMVELDLTHFPVDSQNRSLLALYVNAATGAGYSLATGRTDFSCDITGRDSDTTALADVGGNIGGLPADSNFGYDIPEDFEPAPVQGEIDNPPDIGGDISQNFGDAAAGDTVTATPPCPGGKVCWYRIPKNTETWDPEEGRILDYSAKQEVVCEELGSGWQSGSSLTLTTSDIDYIMYAEASCPDPSAPSGYGTPIPLGNTNPVEPDFASYTYARFVGTVTNTGTSSQFTSTWAAFGSNSFYLGGLRYQGGPEGNTYTAGCYTAIPPAMVCGSLNVPSPWRAYVEARSDAFSGGVYYWFVGGVINMPSAGPPQGTVAFGGSQTVSVSGSWEFTNDVNAGPELSWSGRSY